MAETTIRKMEEQLNCAICLDTYTDPKLLQCFHIYCRKCLVKLVVRDQQGQLILTCPTCRQATPVPADGVAGLQSAFQVNPLLEILESHKKTKDMVASLEEVKSDPIPLPDITSNCLEHTDKEQELYCETCGDLICLKCAIRGGQHVNHDYFPLDEAFERYKGEISPSLEPLEEKLVVVKEALGKLDKHYEEIYDYREVIEADIHNTIRRLHETLDVRKTELIGQLHVITQGKLKDLAVQRDKMETVLAQLSSCLDFVKESLKTENQGEVLRIKTNVARQVKELTTPFPSDIIEPTVEVDMKFSSSPNMTAMCQNFGEVFTLGSPDPSKCKVTGRGLEEAEVEEKAKVVLQAINLQGEPCIKSIDSVQCELVSEITGATVKGNSEHLGQNRYEISYCPIVKGESRLSIKVENTHIRGSPFSVRVKLPVEKLGTPLLTIEGVEDPSGVVVNQRGEVVVTESYKDSVSIFSPSGEKRQSFGTRGSDQGLFETPWGVAVDSKNNILVADMSNHRIQKFTSSGRFLSAVGTKGKRPLQFKRPMDIAVNQSDDKIYVVDRFNYRIQVLNSDLTFSGIFGKKGSGSGRFSNPLSIACDSTGRVYVTDSRNHNIQVFTPEGHFLRMFGKFGYESGEFHCPWDIAIDANDLVYVSDCGNHCISVFTCEGQFVTSFGSLGVGPGKFACPCGVAVNSCGVVYVCDRDNNCIHLF